MPVSASPTAAVFDMGGVLIDWNANYLYRKIIPDEAVRRDFLKNICTREWHEQHDAGISFADNAKELLARYSEPNIQSWIKAWGDRFDEMFGGPIQGTVDIVSELHGRNVPIYGLTNWAHESFEKVRVDKQFPFFSFFTDIVVSGTEKVKKPDVKIYEILIARSQLKAEEMVFIDDREENLAPARLLGFATIEFKSPEALRRDLQKLNLL